MAFWDWFLTALGVGGASNAGSPEPARSAEGGVAVLEAEFPAAAWWSPEPPALTAPVPSRCENPSPEVRFLENILASHFDGHDLTLPAMPASPDQVLKELRHPHCDFAEVARLISDDPVLTAAILRTINSPFYRGESEITSIRTAVTRLGTRALRTLMMHQALQAAMFESRAGNPRRAQTLWRRAQAGAWIMHGLAPLIGRDPDDAFLAGLLHDIGNVLVLRIVSAEEAKMKVRVADDEFEHLCELAHQELGELLATAWKLPRNLSALIRDHHVRPDAADPLAVERQALLLTDMILALLEFAPYQPYDLLNADVASDLGLDADPRFTTLLAALPAELDETLIAL
ncbi:MAG: HDOD domain-containing protein [Phycisphaerae bacterium]|nr:MAG: HDOD domain-containing protein [Planctomycetota bacterium]KAB2946487.1 MAG: HDOD domain-containing protein [Phycisphaerae bacterium]MBE7456696.1 HDOD domain-containing protein [Planctomycetia bacterium]MCK6463926.1 HDOD domain-containing protein [Phycisphaerae bacterium]MCL4718139.1 HDOD domain-containing protein [Phycisphaerae bacterium]